MNISILSANLVIFFAVLIEDTVQWGTRKAQFTAVEAEDVSNDKVSIATFFSASELACSQKCLWNEECNFKKYDVESESCELLQKINEKDFESGALLSKKENPKAKVNNCRKVFLQSKTSVYYYSRTHYL